MGGAVLNGLCPWEDGPLRKWRKWLIRSGILVLLGAVISASWLYQTWTRPAVVRQLLIDALERDLPGVRVELDHAYLRLFGDISISGLRLIRSPDSEPFLRIPKGRLLHDKEQLSNGELVLRKVVLEGPILRLERRPDGSWDLADLLPSHTSDAPWPTVVVRQASVHLHDRGVLPTAVRSGSQVEWQLHGIELTLINDPAPRVSVAATAHHELLGRLELDGSLHRPTQAMQARLQLPQFPVAGELVHKLAAYVPELGDYRESPRGIVGLTAQLAHHPNADIPWQTQVEIRLRKGMFVHPGLPLPLEEIQGTLHYHNGHCTIKQLHGQAGDSAFTVELELLPTPLARAAPAPTSFPLPESLEHRLQRLRVQVRGLTVGPRLTEALPQALRSFPEMFRPTGPLGITFELKRQGDQASKECILEPAGMRIVYEAFPYPVEDIHGSLTLKIDPTQQDRLKVDLSGRASGQPITLQGTMIGNNPGAKLDLVIQGQAIPFNDTLINALKPPFPQFLRSLNATGQGDFRATLTQNPNSNLLHTRFDIDVYDSRMRYDIFPYTMEHVRGKVVIMPTPAPVDAPSEEVASAGLPTDRVEIKDFTARHGATHLRLWGAKGPTDSGSQLQLNIEARGLALDRELRQAIEAIGGREGWDTMQPRGWANCTVGVTIHESHDAPGPDPRGEYALPFDPLTDLELQCQWSGGSIHPIFFPYTLTDLNGGFSYRAGRIVLRGCRARHGKSLLTLEQADIRKRTDGGLWASLSNIQADPLVCDTELFAALPGELGTAWEALKLQGPATLHLQRLVIDDPAQAAEGPRLAQPIQPVGSTSPQDSLADPRSQALPSPKSLPDPQPILYWKGALTLQKAQLQLGVPFTEVIGQVAITGRYEGDRLGRVYGNVALARALVAQQPVHDLQAHFRVDPLKPSILQVPTIRGQLYGGTVHGEARVQLNDPLAFSLDLTAIGVQLEQLAQYYRMGDDAQLQGMATARLYLTQQPGDSNHPPDLRGGGTIDVPQGKMLNLPFLLDLLKVLNLRAPDRTAFEEAHAVFSIHGEQIQVQQLDLLGNAISLGGGGQLRTDGSDVQFEFYTIWSRLLKDWLAAPLGHLSSAISKELFKIQVRGAVGGTIEYRKMAVPLVAEPVRHVLERMWYTPSYQRWWNWATY